MNANKEITCIGCPMGCLVTVELENSEIKSIAGYTCPRGKDYAEKELTHPERTVTSTVPVDGGNLHMVPVKTMHDIPKDKIFDSMVQIRATRLHAPVKAGDVVIKNIAGTGVDIIATRSVDVRNQA